MDAEDPCPSADDLHAFAAGTLDRAVMDRLAAHVVRCAACDALLAWESITASPTRVGRLQLTAAGVDTPAPARFGDRYRLGERLGAGGMGHVYRADQVSPIRRPVAVKVLKPGLDSADFLARFETERQSVARMDHPNIARLYDAGLTDDDRPYFALELVPGFNIVAHADAHRLTTRERVALFLPVCRAVQHAHQKGVIHRDLKPTNVLVAVVDGLPVPKVIDFGIAKAVAEDRTPDAATRPGLVVGTPEYMSPEQAAGPESADIDTRSDIYSLGVLLYELLTGTPPFTLQSGGGSVWDLLRTIRDVDAPRPSTQVTAPAADLRGADLPRLRKQLTGDLEWVLLKALARDRDRRYPTANAFAADLELYLADEPVTAGPPTRRYRFGKFVRRNRTAVAASVAVAVALLAGATGATVGLFRSLEAERIARDAERTALDALARETAAREAAVESDQVARESLAKVKTAELQARLDQARAREAEVRATEQKDRAVAADAKTRATLYAATDVVVEDLLRRRQKLSREEAAFLKRLRDLHAQLALSPADDPLAYFESARQLGMIHEALGALGDAEAVFAQVVGALAPLATTRPADRPLHLALARAHQRLAVIRRARGDGRGAEAANKASAAVAEALLARNPDDLEAQAEAARAHGNLAHLFAETNPGSGRVADEHRAAVEAFAALAGRDPKYRRDYGVSLYNLAQMCITQGNYPPAARHLRDSLAVREPLAAEGGHDRFPADLARAWSSLGVTLQAMGDLLGAEEATAKGLNIRRRMAEDEPGVSTYQTDFARTLMNLAMIRGQLGRRSQVEALLAGAIAVVERQSAAAPDDPAPRLTLGFAHALLSDHLSRTGEGKLALAAAARGLDLIRPLEGVAMADYQHRQTRSALLRQRAVALAAVGRYKDAASDWAEVRPLVPPPERPLVAAMLADCLARAGDREHALAVLKELEQLPLRPVGVQYRMAAASAALAATPDDADADRAVRLLSSAVAGRFNEYDEFDADPAFRKLADRADYRAAVAKLRRRELAPLPHSTD